MNVLPIQMTAINNRQTKMQNYRMDTLTSKPQNKVAFGKNYLGRLGDTDHSVALAIEAIQKKWTPIATRLDESDYVAYCAAKARKEICELQGKKVSDDTLNAIAKYENRETPEW